MRFQDLTIKRDYKGRWFAWYPVRLGNTRTYIWLEHVNREWFSGADSGFWYYSEIKESSRKS